MPKQPEYIDEWGTVTEAQWDDLVARGKTHQIASAPIEPVRIFDEMWEADPHKGLYIAYMRYLLESEA